MAFFLLAGFVPLAIVCLLAGLYLAARGNTSPAARELGDRVGRRSGIDRRQQSLAFVGADRRSGVDRRAAEAQRDERVA